VKLKNKISKKSGIGHQIIKLSDSNARIYPIKKKTGFFQPWLKVVKKAGEKVSAFYEEERDIMARAASPWLTKLDYAFQVEGKRAALCLGQQCEHLPCRCI
jgi:hypothetical protein